MKSIMSGLEWFLSTIMKHEFVQPGYTFKLEYL